MSDPILDGFWKAKTSRWVWEDKKYWIAPSLGPLNATHFLVCTKKHYPCLRDAPPSVVDEFMELLVSIEKIDITSDVPSQVVWFENGNAESKIGQTECVDHVHAHIILLPKTAVSQIFDGFDDVAAGNFSNSLVGLEKSGRYICAGFQGKRLLKESSEIHPQMMRRRIADTVKNGENWNWRDRPNVRLMEAMQSGESVFLQELRSVLSKVG